MRHALWLVLLGCAATPTTTTTTPTAALLPADAPQPQTWRPLTNTPPLAGASAPQLMTDATVLVQDIDTEQWWKLTPDEFGGYENGTWSAIAPAPAGYSPLYYASATLPDGRLIVEGGEYIAGNPVWTTDGAIYDPIADTWKRMTPPAGWQTIGDASGMVLANGTFVLSSCCDPSMGMALLDPIALTWRPTGTGKADEHDEEAWAMLRDGRVLTTDAANTADPNYSEVYDPVTGKWSAAGDVPVILSDNPAVGGNSYEVGPEVLRLDGTVVAFGGTPHNAVYDPATSTWSALPDFPDVGGSARLTMADAPAAVMPNGDVLIVTSPLFTLNVPGVHMFEVHDSTFTEVPAPPHSPNDTSYEHALLVLPTGEILHTQYDADVELYTPVPGFPDLAQPVIVGAPELLSGGPAAQTAPIASLYPGRVYTITVRRMNGITQGGYYGDDVQTYTNFPIVRVTNTDTGHVVYCRTHDHSDRSIAPDEQGQTRFDVPDTMETGLSELSVIANGIASPPIDVNVK